MNKRIVLLILLMFAIAGFGITTALGDHAQEEGNVLTIASNGSEVLIAWSDLTTGPVQGTLLNGRGETTQINSEGIALQSLLDAAEVEAQEKVTLIAADGYQAEISAEELAEANRVWLILSDDGFRLIVFGDRDSKQFVKNVVRMVVE